MRIAAATMPIQSRVSIWSEPGEWGAKARPFYSRGAAPRLPAAFGSPTYTRQPHEEALPAIERAPPRGAGRRGRGDRRRGRGALPAQAPGDPDTGDGRRGRGRPAGAGGAAAALQAPRRRPLRAAD